MSIRHGLVDRKQAILDAVSGQNVLHLGCADAPLQVMRAATGTLLHSHIRRVARNVVGIDLDPEGVRYLREELGFGEVVRGDVTRLDDLGFTETFDAIVAGELLEHLPNPGLCLASCRSVLRKEGQLIVSVPNAFSAKAFARACLGREIVHPDHVAYYSALTLTRLLEQHEFRIERMHYYASIPDGTFKRAIEGVLMAPLRSLAPQVSEGLVVFAAPHR